MPQRHPLEPGEWTLVAPVPLPGDGCRVGACRAVLTQGISPWALVTFGTHYSLLQGVLEIAGCLAVPLASTHEMSEHTHSGDNHKRLQPSGNVPWWRSCPRSPALGLVALQKRVF